MTGDPHAARGEVVAVIPARGGSKGVPRKNVRRVGGVPLVARAIDAAREARVDRIVVSTDDDEIAGVASEWGAEVIARPAALAGDEASSESALLHALDVLEERAIRIGTLVFLQATSPFIDPAALATAIARVRSGTADSVFSSVETYGFLWSGDAAAVGVNHDAAHRPRRQDREPHHLETGAFYAMDAAGFRAARHRFFGRTQFVDVPERTAIEIDTEEQLALAAAIAPLIDVVPRPADVVVDAVVTDFDGVHTDDSVIVDQDGRESVRVSRSDGMGIARLRAAGIPVLILSSEENAVVAARAAKLRVDVRHGVSDKAAVLREWAGERGIPLSRIAYLGNDLNDLDCLDIVGLPVAVPEAHPLALAAARLVVTRPGGGGAVRELAEFVLAARAARSVPTISS